MVATRGAGASVNYTEQPLHDSPPPRRTRRRGAISSTTKSEDNGAESDVSSTSSGVGGETRSSRDVPQGRERRQRSTTGASFEPKQHKARAKRGSHASELSGWGNTSYPLRSRGSAVSLIADAGSSGRSSTPRTKTRLADAQETFGTGSGRGEDQDIGFGRAESETWKHSEPDAPCAGNSLDDAVESPSAPDSKPAIERASAPSKRMHSQRRKDQSHQSNHKESNMLPRIFTRTLSGRKVVRQSYNEDSSSVEDEVDGVNTPPAPAPKLRQQQLRSRSRPSVSSLVARYEAIEVVSQSPVSPQACPSFLVFLPPSLSSWPTFYYWRSFVMVSIWPIAM